MVDESKMESALTSETSASPPIVTYAQALAILGCFATGVAGLIYAFQRDDVWGLFAAVLGFGVVLCACCKK